MTTYMADSQTGGKRHLVASDNLSRTLCRVRPWTLIRNWRTKELVPFAAHWEDNDEWDVLALPGGSHDLCQHCWHIHRRRQR